MTTTRRLSAILAADVVGYSRLMQQDDQATVRALTERRAIFAERVAARRGRIVNAPGDSILAEFPSVTDAVDCAVEIQTEIAAHNAAIADPDRRMQFRIGVNLGDVIVEGDGIYGDGVNIAARLESLADYGGIALSVNAYEQVRDKLPYRFVDRGEQRVKNIARPVRVYAVDMSASGISARKKPMPRRRVLWAAAIAALVVAALLAFPRLVEREPPTQAASIAVLPFANHSADAKREFFSDGLTEDVINALGRFSAIRVIAHNTVQAYKYRTVAPEQISRELGVRYVVQGSVRQADGRLRVGVELSDAMKGTLLWSERYDGEGKEVFEIQDRIVRNIAGSLAVKLSALEQQRTAAKPPESLEAYELVLRAREPMRAVQRSANREARALIAQAIKMSPNYAEAHAALAFAELQRAFFGWMEDPSDGLRRAEQAARRALAIDDPGANARAHAILGNIHTFTGNYEAALAEADRAIELNPSDAIARSLRGGILLWTGKIEESIAASEAARRYDPRLPAEGMFNLALAYYLAGRYREAVQTAAALQPNARTVFLEAVHAGALAQLGEGEAARRVAADVRRLDPFFDVKLFGRRLVNPAHRDKAQEGLRKAGL
ncbi:MAG TPA: adenylate/guanylate cyclase domain-containing protein [Burkholderiales bacterium]|nr:adenylate/guanylate cyclase domain-containing protein [Burkholderiales bacterium]